MTPLNHGYLQMLTVRKVDLFSVEILFCCQRHFKVFQAEHGIPIFAWRWRAAVREILFFLLKQRKNTALQKTHYHARLKSLQRLDLLLSKAERWLESQIYTHSLLGGKLIIKSYLLATYSISTPKWGKETLDYYSLVAPKWGSTPPEKAYTLPQNGVRNAIHLPQNGVAKM